MTTLPGTGVAALGDYQKTLERLTAKYPNLANNDYKIWAQPGEFASPPRLACFQFSTNATAPKAPVTTLFNGLDEVKLFLNQLPIANTSSSPIRQIFLLEGLHPSYVTELGQKLEVDPRVWLRHQRVAVWEKAVFNAGNSPRLPTVSAEEGSFCLDYCQLMHLNVTSQDFTLRCAENERHIASSRQGQVSGREFDGIGMVHRKISFWSHKLDNGGWIGKLDVRLLEKG